MDKAKGLWLDFRVVLWVKIVILHGTSEVMLLSIRITVSHLVGLDVNNGNLFAFIN